MVDYLAFDYEENRDLIMLAIDSFLVLFDEQQSLVPSLPYDDLSAILCQHSLVENVALVIPKIIHSIETITVLNEHSQAERYLEKAFDVL